MKVSSIATIIIASTFAPQVVARVSSIRALQTEDDNCLEAQKKAAELIESAEVGCGSAASNPSWTDGAVTPNPTCLLLLCTAQRSGKALLEANCDDYKPLLGLADGWGARGLCELVPGFLPPLGPEVNGVEASFNFTVDGESIDIDVLRNDTITYGNPITVSVTSQPQNGQCKINDDNHVVFTPSADIDNDPPKQICAYEVCYTGRYAGQCGQANVSIGVDNAPTGSPTSAPTIGCSLDLNITNKEPFPPKDFDARAECKKDPSELILKFNSGNCVQDKNDQWGKSSCTDSDSGPPTGDGYVVINDWYEKAYFAGTVKVGELIRLTSSGGEVIPSPGVNEISEMHKAGDYWPTSLEIMVYSNSSKVEPLQTVEFHSSCSRTLKLQDKFGGFEVVEFTTSEQGVVSIFQYSTLNWLIMNTGIDTVELLQASIDFSNVTELVDVGNKTVAAGQTFELAPTVLIDTTAGSSANYTGIVTGENNHTGGKCEAVYEGTVVWEESQDEIV